MEISISELFRPRRSYDQLICDLRKYFNSSSYETVRRIDCLPEKRLEKNNPGEVDKLNRQMSHCFLEKKHICLENTNVSLENLVQSLSGISTIKSAINELRDGDGEVFMQYFNELEEAVGDIKKECQCYQGKSIEDRESSFQKIVDGLKRMLSKVLVERFVDNINDRRKGGRTSHDSLLKALNEYMGGLGVYTVPLANNYRNRNQNEYSPTEHPEYTKDATQHNLIKEIVRLPYCFEYSKSSKTKQIVAAKGLVQVYSNKIEEG